MSMYDLLTQSGVVAILRGTTREEAIGTVAALAEAGIKGIEVTFNTPGATGIIAELARRHPDLCVGAGTVMTTDDVSRAAEAGARFVLSPDMNVEVIQATKLRGMFSVPGAVTPTEIVTAIRAGADIVKIFPAGSLGPAYFKDLLGPLHYGRFMPVGGVSLENTAQFIRAGAVAVGAGGCLVNKKLIDAKDWKALTALGQQFLEQVRKGRNS